MAFLIFNGHYQQYPGYSATDLGLDGTFTTPAATSTQPQLYTVSTAGIGSVLLVPEVGVNLYSGLPGVNGVLTEVTFSPSATGSISGDAVSVEVEVGSFAYYQQLLSAVNQFRNDEQAYLNAGTDITDVDNYVGVQINAFLYGKETEFTAVDNLQREANSLGGSYANLVSDIGAIVPVLEEWNTPLYWIDTGSGWQQTTDGAIGYGVDLITVNGATATWSVNGSTGGVDVAGYSAVSRWNYDPGTYWSNGNVQIEDADTDGWLDVTSYAPPHDGLLPISQLISQGIAPNGNSVTSYVIWFNGDGGAQVLINGIAQQVKQSIAVNPSNISQAQYRTGSGHDTLWIESVYSDGTSSWSRFDMAGPIDTGPTVAVTSLPASHGQVFNASALFSNYSAPFGDAAVSYDFWNRGTGGGYFQLGNLPPYASNQEIVVSAAQLSSLGA